MREPKPLGFTGAKDADRFPLYQSFVPSSSSPLNGRTLAVARVSDIALRPKKVVLTFDDGPMPGKTGRILKALDDYGVGATFLMVGEMARSYPQVVREVADHGHTIGTHTEDHPNLAKLPIADAMAEIHAGERSVSAALAPIGRHPAPFFRFPYLAETPTLREKIRQEGLTAIEVDIDSDDYFHETSEEVEAHTLSALDKHDHGIILFHDIHGRTAAMLPDFLGKLQERGFKVVRLVPADTPDPMLVSDKAEKPAAADAVAAEPGKSTL